MKRYNLLLIPLITVMLSNCVTVKTKNSIEKLIDRHPNIISVVEHWGFEDDDYYWYEIQFYRRFSLDIKMENGKRLFLSYIHPSNPKAPFNLYLIGKSTFEILHFSGKETNHWVGIPIDFIAINIGVQINSVSDVIENYDLIFNFTDSLTKLADIDDIDVKNEIISGLEYSYSLGGYRLIKHIQPIITGEDKWYILNVTYDEVPNAKKFEELAEIAMDRIRRYFHYREGVEGNQLTSLTVPDGVTVIGPVEFQSNQLSSVTIPDSVASIGTGAFQDNRLTSITIPDSVISIGSGAFQNNRLTSVTIPDSVTGIGAGAFYNNRLTSVTIGNGVTSIGKYAFFKNQLTTVTIPDSITFVDLYTFSDNQLTSVTIPDSVTGIGAGAFYNNRLTSVTIPDSVTRIEGSAFENNRLTSVTIPDSVTSIWGSAFSNNPLTSVTIGKNVTAIGRCAFFKNQLTSVTIPDSVTSIGAGAFEKNLLTSVTIPDNVTSIEFRAFSNNPLTGITIGANVDIEADISWRWGRDRGSYRSFPAFYNGNGKKAGVYTYNRNRWSYSAR
jgi:hypothetical protein